MTQLLRPKDQDYFVLKPKHSGLYASPFGLLRRSLHAPRLILTGVPGDNCVLCTAADGYRRECALCVSEDWVVSIDAEGNREALRQMRANLQADVLPSKDIHFLPLS